MSELSTAEVERLLKEGTVEVLGLVPWGSNYTFLAEVCIDSRRAQAIYKPQRGERPLWDFATGTLCLRERAAFVLSRALSWEIVPPTILREGPQGYGSVQFYIEHDPDRHYFTFEGQYRRQIERIQLFDVLANNADRKGGHILLDESAKLWAIDHGVCFHTQYKLRSVVWEYAGMPIPATLQQDLRRLQQRLIAADADSYYRKLADLLSPAEMKALRKRTENLLATGIYPEPGPGRPYPWPLV